MPDLISVFAKWWKFILGLSLLAMTLSFAACLLSPRKYLSTATALPANTMMADKARVFNERIEALYSDYGIPDELDKLEGTAALDTIFISASEAFDLAGHYGIPPSDEAPFKAALRLRKESHIARSGYNELKIQVWDADRNMAATLANSLMKNIQELQQHLQNANNLAVLGKLKEIYQARQQAYRQLVDTATSPDPAAEAIREARKKALLEQLQQYEKTIDQYAVAVQTNPPVLLVVEPARAALWPDKPKTALTMLLTLIAALLCTFLLSMLLETGKTRL